MAQVAPVAGFPSEGKVVEVDTSGGVTRAYHTKGRWWDENGRPISVRGWRYIHTSAVEGESPDPAKPWDNEEEHKPEPEERKVVMTSREGGPSRIDRLTKRRPAESKSS